MTDWALIVALCVALGYRLLDKWLDGRNATEANRESDTYTATETSSRDAARDDGGYGYRPDVQLGFQRSGQ